MIIKLDENLGRPHVALLKRRGYDADRVFDQGLSVTEFMPVTEPTKFELEFNFKTAKPSA